MKNIFKGIIGVAAFGVAGLLVEKLKLGSTIEKYLEAEKKDEDEDEMEKREEK